VDFDGVAARNAVVLSPAVNGDAERAVNGDAEEEKAEKVA
jgi:hypothetical protein